MSPEKIAQHEPTAVKRNPNDQGLEAREKLKKNGMTKV
jgi:hypothetical protein